VGDEDHVASARLAREREPVALVEVVVGPSETVRRATLERLQPRCHLGVLGTVELRLHVVGVVVPLVVGVELSPRRVERVTRHDLHFLVDVERSGVLLHPLCHGVASRMTAELQDDHELDHSMTRFRVLNGRGQTGRVQRLEGGEVGIDVEIPMEERTDDVGLLLGGTPVDRRGAEQAARDRFRELRVHGSHAFLLPWTLRAHPS
jgi:hypothetical protein